MYVEDMYYSDSLFFFFNDTATTEIYTLSLHDALPISKQFTNYRRELDTSAIQRARGDLDERLDELRRQGRADTDLYATLLEDRKSTRLNSSHANISYAVFCLKKKTQNLHILHQQHENR